MSEFPALEKGWNACSSEVESKVYAEGSRTGENGQRREDMERWWVYNRRRIRTKDG